MTGENERKWEPDGGINVPNAILNLRHTSDADLRFLWIVPRQFKKQKMENSVKKYRISSTSITL